MISKYVVVISAFIFFGLYNSSAQITKQWVATYNGTGDFNDRFIASTQDASGNIIVAGSTVNPDADRDILVIKYNSSGVQQWMYTLNGSANGPDEATAITTDASGNIYVTGFSKLIVTNTDYFALKLNSSGSLQWVQYYDFANEYDQANAIALDLSGNVFITGQSDQDSSANTNDDYATIKYNSSGVQQWVKRYNGAGQQTDRAEKIVIDGSGNLYVTGRSNNGGDDDYVTIKYNNSGTVVFTKFDDRGGNDRPYDMVIDASNNLYITGKSDNGNNYDFWTIKYNSSGTQLWAKAFDYVDDDIAESIKVDASGNVFICGESDGDATAVINYDYQTVAYNSSGSLLWQKRFNGSANNDDIPAMLATNGTNVYVTGKSDTDANINSNLSNLVTLIYNNSNGNQVALVNYSGAGGQDDASNTIFTNTNGFVVAGFEENALARRNALVIQYNSTGSTLAWKKSFDGVGDNNDNTRDIDVDVAGNVHVAGYVVHNGNNRDFTMVKFSNTGTYNCDYYKNGSTTGSTDDGSELEIANNGKIVVAGYVRDKGVSSDIYYAMIDPSTCDTTWTRKVDGPGSGSDRIYAMTKDNNGNIYMTGKVDSDPSSGVNEDVVTMKIDNNGNTLWTQYYTNTSQHAEDKGTHIAAAPDGNIYVSGKSWNGTNYDVLLIKYSSTGSQIWSKTFDGNNGNDQTNNIYVDANNNCYIVGESQQIGDTIFDCLTLAYTSNGTLSWSKIYNGTANGDDKGTAICADNNGNVYVCGYSDQTAGIVSNTDMITIKYDNTGNQLWLKNINGTSNNDDFADDIKLYDNNHIIVAGHINKGNNIVSNYDCKTIMYDALGGTIWTDTHNSTYDSSDVPNRILIKNTDLYIAGSTIAPNEMRNMMVIKYANLPASTLDVAINQLLYVYPNPVEQDITINNTLGATEVRIFNTLGQLVLDQTLHTNSNTVSVKNLSTGLLYLQIFKSNQLIQSNKIIHQ